MVAMPLPSGRVRLGAVAGLGLTACSRQAGHTWAVSRSAAVRHAYGPEPAQFGDLYRPAGGAAAEGTAGTVVVIHGGFWRSAYDLSLGAPLAADLADRGYTAWNLEYRRVGDGGGWPATLADVAAGIDHLATLDVDTSRVAAIGHSAGGHLAAWAAGRGALPEAAPGASPRVRITAVVAQAGVLDLTVAATTAVGATAVPDLLGGSPEQVPQRYAVADPIRQVPLAAPVLCLHSRADQNVPYAQSTAYVAAATAAGATATLRETKGDHFTLIDPAAAPWRTVVAALPGLLRA
jgi:acetyl esterase/lipase